VDGNNQKIFNVAQAAHFLSVSPKTIRRWAQQGKHNMNTNTWIAVIVALIIGALGGWFFGTSQPSYKPPQQVSQTSNVTSTKSQQLKTDMRKLWEDHVIWTREYLDSAILGAGDTDVILARLMKNQEDIGNAIKPVYGDEAGNKLTSLLKEHISLAGEVVKAAKSADVAGLKTADDKWHANGNDIADFLASANPNWSKDGMRSMMNDHLNLTRQEAVDMLAKRTDASIADYDKVHNQILNMADMLSEGIIKQYPDKL
jgi:hypothetical protein